jgi:Sec-independent protein translocase protein TatA
VDFLGTPTHLLFLVAVVLLFFGSTRLPKLARSLREARDEFTKGSDEQTSDEVPGKE